MKQVDESPSLPEDDPDRMPKKRPRMSDQEIATIAGWVSEGARYPAR